MEEQKDLKVVFAGTPEFAAEHLKQLIASNHTVVAVYTQPDRPSGRGKSVTQSPVKKLAIEAGIPVLQPENLKALKEQQTLRLFNPDVMVVVAYGLILPLHILDTPVFGCINVHASLLPRWRGAAPIQRAIEAGDEESGVTIMQMDEGLDTGDMLRTASCPIEPQDTAGILHNRLAKLGPPALLDVLDQLLQGGETRERQNHIKSSYAKKLLKNDAKISWEESATNICRKIRAFNPVPVCFSFLLSERLRIHMAVPLEKAPDNETRPGEVIDISAKGLIVACGKGAISIEKLQSPGKKPMGIANFYNGHAQLVKKGDFFN